MFWLFSPFHQKTRLTETRIQIVNMQPGWTAPYVLCNTLCNLCNIASLHECVRACLFLIACLYFVFLSFPCFVLFIICQFLRIKDLCIVLQTTLQTVIGQNLDLTTAAPITDRVNFAAFTIERYNAIVKYKTGFYSFYLSVASAMYLVGRTNIHSYSQNEVLSPYNFIGPTYFHFRFAIDFFRTVHPGPLLA